jgi:transcriptional regulator with PAS, ATPase and Fis domain
MKPSHGNYIPKDLWYRFKCVIEVPPLRKREPDWIGILGRHLGTREDKEKELPEELARKLCQVRPARYNDMEREVVVHEMEVFFKKYEEMMWTGGNVRELDRYWEAYWSNVPLQATDERSIEWFVEQAASEQPETGVRTKTKAKTSRALRALNEMKKRMAKKALENCAGKQGDAAKRLGIDPKTLRDWEKIGEG